MNSESRQKVVREIRITSTLSTAHKGIIGLSEIFIHDSRIFIAMEIGEGGDLFEVVMTKKGGLPEPVAISLFRQMVEAVSFLHAMGISHRDIKPENFLLTANNEIKLCDFGFCANFFRDDDDDEDQVAAVEQLPFGTPCGTASYIAPEVILGQRYTQAVDVWSLGVSLYVMVSGLDPWGSPARARERKLSGDFKPLPNISEQVAGLLRRMIQPEPSKRITIQQVLADPLIAGAGRIQNGRELLIGVSPKTLARLNRRNVG
jgi:serine/threonine protein kinase